MKDPLFGGIVAPAMVPEHRPIHGERVQARRQDGMIQVESIFGPEITAMPGNQSDPEVEDGR